MCSLQVLPDGRWAAVNASRFSAEVRSIAERFGLLQETVHAAGLRRIAAAYIRERFGLPVPSAGVLFPYPGCNGFARVRLDQPFQAPGWDKPAKYLTAPGAGNHLYLPPNLPADALVGIAPLVLTEGEKKALRACEVGIPCIATAGIWSWKQRGPDGEKLPDTDGRLPDFEHIRWADREVVFLVYDSDITAEHPGHPAYLRLAVVLHERGAKALKVFALPALPGFTKVGLDDYLSHHDAASFWQLAQSAALWRPKINAGVQDLESITGQAIRALEAANWPPRMFVRGNCLARLERDTDAQTGSVVVRELGVDRVRHELARAAKWVVLRKAKGVQEIALSVQGDSSGLIEVDASPPLEVCRDLLAASSLPFPPLRRIVQAPVFGSDGSLRTKAGYHRASQTYLDFAPGFTLPPVPERPGPSDLATAKVLLLEELLHDFPFAGPADRAHAVALLLLPFVRELVAGCTPLHVIEASGPGSGKALLASVLLLPALGREPALVPPFRDDDELRKALTARLRHGVEAIIFDNMGSLTSPVLSAALTASFWDDRLLGKTETLRLPVTCTWAATVNNATVSTDIARRCVRIRLEPRWIDPGCAPGFGIQTCAVGLPSTAAS
jgi:hypothetical protein